MFLLGWNSEFFFERTSICTFSLWVECAYSHLNWRLLALAVLRASLLILCLEKKKIVTRKFASDAELFKVIKKKKSRLTEELEDSRLIKHAVKWQMEFNVNKCSEAHGGAILYNYQLLPFLESNLGVLIDL